MIFFIANCVAATKPDDVKSGSVLTPSEASSFTAN